MNALAKWMAKATPAQQRSLARRARTTLGTLRQIAGAYRTGGVGAALAGRIDRGTKGVVPREALSPACRACEFAKRCRG